MSALWASGCADFGGFAFRVPWESPPDRIPGVPTPAERIGTLQQLGQRAASADAQTRQSIAAQLAEAIQNEADPMIRAEIVRALGSCPCAATDRLLHAALTDPEMEVRVAACESWGRRGNAEAVQTLSRALESDVDKDVRLAAARALGSTKDPAALTALGEVLVDKDPAIQYRAVLSLRKITGKDFGNDVDRWRQYVRGELPTPRQPVSVAERFWPWF